MIASRPRHGRLALLLGGLMLLVTLLVMQPVGLHSSLTTPAGAAQSPPTPTEVLGIVSPIAAPACQASGAATLLVPILAGSLEGDLHLQNVDLSTTLLDVLGPLFIVCADLPAPNNLHCQLDNQLVGIWPSQLAQLLPPPSILGDIVDSGDAAGSVLGQPPATLGLDQAFACSVPAPPAVPAPPPAPTGPALLPSVASIATPVPATSLGSGLSTESTMPSSSLRPAQQNTAQGAASLVKHYRNRLVSILLPFKVAAFVRTFQWLMAAMLALVLGASWVGTRRISRTKRHT